MNVLIPFVNCRISPGILQIQQLKAFRTNTPKRCPFYYRGLECKSRKSRNTWSSRQIWLGIWNEAGQRLIEFCQENTLLITNTLFQQHKRRLHMDITRWSTLKSDWLYSLQPKMEKLLDYRHQLPHSYRISSLPHLHFHDQLCHITNSYFFISWINLNQENTILLHLNVCSCNSSYSAYLSPAPSCPFYSFSYLLF